MNELDEIYFRALSNDALGGDLTALNAVKWDRVEDDVDGQSYGHDDMTGQRFALGEAMSPVTPAPSISPVAPATVEEKDTSIGTVLGDLDAFLNAPFAGVGSGVARFLGNTAAAAGVVDQEDVDKFFSSLDNVNKAVTADAPATKLLHGAGGIAGQYILPAVTGYNALRSVGAAPLLASIVSEGLTGLLGISPNDENIFNMIAEDTNSPAGKAVRELMATNPEDGEWTNRAKNAGEALVFLGGSEALMRGLPKLVQQGKQFVASDKGQQILNHVEEMGAQADQRLSSMARGDTLSANPIGAAGDLALSAAGKLAGRVDAAIKMPKQKALAPSGNELRVINSIAKGVGQAQIAVDTVARVRSRFPVGTGREKFAEFEVVGGTFKTKDGVTTFKPQIKQVPYNFGPPKGTDAKKYQTKMANSMVSDVGKIIDRAKAGDKAAIDIIAEARWYRDMRVSLRREFGGMGDMFADLLGATSAQTNVKDNFANSIDIIKRFARGDFDKEIAAWEKRLADGEVMDPTKLQQLHKAKEFPLISKAAGGLYNANSPAASKALFDTFRMVKAGSSPKTINFTGNLIGYSNDATIDVWAARYLRNKSGQPYLPPPSEQAVAGKHSKGSTLDKPKIGGDFGFGQKVFAEATKKLNKKGVITDFNPSLGEVGADDLQAIVWFMEKEKWTKNGWTTKAGEGGSLDFEMNVAGAADPAAMEAARKSARASFKPPARRKTETDEQYDIRLQNAESAHIARTLNAEQSVGEQAAQLDRTVVGITAERPNKVPSNYEQAEVAAEVDDVLRDNPAVVTYKATNTRGMFEGVQERSLDVEIITRPDFNPTDLKRRIAKIGLDKDQDAVFVSKVLKDPVEGQGNPGLELYFNKKQSVDFTADLAEKLRERGLDGFTFITDARQADRINVQARAQDGGDTAGITGLRVQYIPEFESAPTAARREEMENIFDDLAREYAIKGDISASNAVYYETEVYRRSTGTEWMSGGRTYEDAIGTTD